MPKLQWKRFPAAALQSEAGMSADWNRLNAERGSLPFMSAEAICTALRCLGTGSEQLLVAHEGAARVAMVLLSRAGKGGWVTFQPSQLPLGAWVGTQSHSVSSLASSLIHSGTLPLALSISFTQLDSRHVAKEPDTSSSRSDEYIDTAWVDIEGSFDDYWAQRGKNLRQNMRKQRNKLQADGITTELRLTISAADMPAAVIRYGELEGRGWKSQHGTAIKPDNAQGRFYIELLSTLAEQGRARVYEYVFGDEVVASNLCVLSDGVMVILKTTYNESIQTLSPAFLLHQDLIQALFEQQEIRRIEYYGRVMDWHTRWTEAKRSIYHLTMFRHSLVKRLAEARARSTARSGKSDSQIAEVETAS